ncbi:NAD(P)-binding protein [Xylariaceae sp. FL0594]|nr:NAD(P)-binding protein [Xylariaceae sp. FL0594]
MFDGHTTSEEVISAFGSEIKGKTFVLIGAGYPSIGSQMATYIAGGSPSHIVIASRTGSKVEPVIAKIREIDAGVKTTFVQVDVTDFESVRRAAAEILEAVGGKGGIDVLIHTAGAMAIKEYTLDKQGFEYQLSANHLGGFLLVNLLAPALNKGARFVILTSSGYRLSPFRFDDYNFSNGETYEPWTAYGQGKTANILFAYGLGKRLKDKGVVSLVVHPGYNGDTKLGEHLTWDDYGAIDGVMKKNRGIEWVWEEPRFKNFSQIAATPLIAALDPSLADKAPAFLQNSQITQADEHATDPESVERLWKLSEKLVGQTFEY